MVFIEGNSVRITPFGYTRTLLRLLEAIMTELAKWLQVFDIPKQTVIPFVGYLVVYGIGCSDTPKLLALDAQRVRS